MSEVINSIGSLIVSLIDNPVGGYVSWALLTAAVAGWVYGGGAPPTNGPQPLPA